MELQLFGTEEKNLRLLESAAVICNRLKGMQTIQTILATAIHTLGRDASPLKCASAKSLSLGIGEQPQDKVCC